MRKVKIKKERKHITYSDHWHAAKCLLEKGEENEEGSHFQFLSSIIFTVFSLEAFLNPIGENKFKSWNEMEKLSPKSKLNILYELL